VDKKKEIILFLLILAIAIFFRLWKLNEIPPGLYPDVALNGNEALDAIKSGHFKIFYPENNGREGLFINLIAFSFLILGSSIFAIKTTAVIIGILTVIGFYFLSREIFGSKVALFSTFFLATSFWHTNFSRLGFRAIMLPFCLVFSFWLLFRALRTKSVFDYIISAVFFGLGFYTYTSFRLAVLILPFVLIPFWFIYKKEKQTKKFLLSIFCFLFSVFIIALPLGLYFLHHPQDFMSRMTGISVFAQKNPIKSFFESLVLHLGMFNFHGDPNWRHNLSGSPMLPPVLGVFFVFGIIISFKEIILSLKKKGWPLAINYWLVVVWFFAMLLPGVLTAEGLPHSLRTIGVIPPVYIFSGLGTLWFLEKLKFMSGFKKRWLFFVFCFVVFASIGYTEYDKYFVDWGRNPQTKDELTQRFVDIGNYLNSLPQDIKKYIIVNESGVAVPWPNGIPMPAQTPIFIERTIFGEPRAFYIDYMEKKSELEKIEVAPHTVFIPMKFDRELFKKLRELFPQGEVKNISNDVWIYKID